MDIFPSESNKKYHSSLPPIQQPINNSWKTQESLSNKLQLYIKFRTSSKITINSPIESLLPSSISKRNNSVPGPTQADIVMSSKPPQLNHKIPENFKYSRLFEIRKIKDNSFLQMSFKAQEQPKPKVPKPRNLRVKKLQRMKNENFSKKSIPFLSDILNKVYRQGSKVLFSPHGLLESSEVLCSFDNNKKEKLDEEGGWSEEEFNADDEVARTIDAAMQTEKVEMEQKNKRRVIFNKNSSFRKKNLSEIESESECVD